VHRGYVKLWRVSLEKPIFQKPELWQFATWCLMKATHKKRTQLVGFQQVELEPGQFIFGRDSAAEQLLSTPQKIRTCVKILSNLEFITIKSTNKYSVITIINWRIYQPEENNSTSNLTTNQPATNQQITTNKNVKNVKNNNNPPTPLSGGTVYSKSFLDWYELYPEKKGKGAAYKSWQKIGKKGIVTPKELMVAIEAQVKANHFRGRDGQDYIPNPSTWLNQYRWEDEIKNNKAQSNTLPEVMENPYG
jgi:hypothetical protein